MRAYEFLFESRPRTLYHGTLKANLPSIKQGGLEPRIGAFTSHFYDADEDDLDELVFASSRKDVQKGLNSIIHYLKQQGIPSTPDNVIKYGAMVVVKDEYNEFDHRPSDDMNDWGDHPYQVEPGDFYAREPVQATYILTDRKLKDLLRREGFDAWMGTKHPKLQKEAKYDYSLADFQAIPYDPGSEWRETDRLTLTQPHRGPQEGKYLNLMLKGMKPAAMIDSWEPTGVLELFKPYIESGRFTVGYEGDEGIVVTLPGEEWRGPKIIQAFKALRKAIDSDEYDENLENKLHAKLGMLLGIPKESIRYFIQNNN